MYQEQAAGKLEVTRELERVDGELGNLRQAIKGGLKDLDWANAEIDRLKGERETLLDRQETLGDEPVIPELDLTQVKAHQDRFSEILTLGTNQERREVVRAFVKRVDVDPSTAEITMHLFSRPPSQINTPSQDREGVSIGVVAGTLYGAIHKMLRGVLRKTFLLDPNGRDPLSRPDHHHLGTQSSWTVG